jgi:hypothetical protein
MLPAYLARSGTCLLSTLEAPTPAKRMTPRAVKPAFRIEFRTGGAKCLVQLGGFEPPTS